MNDKADFAPIRWSYKKTREVARRMDGMSEYRIYITLFTQPISYSIPW